MKSFEDLFIDMICNEKLKNPVKKDKIDLEKQNEELDKFLQGFKPDKK